MSHMETILLVLLSLVGVFLTIETQRLRLRIDRIEAELRAIGHLPSSYQGDGA